jgi:multidrug efflux pump subunit AcrB
VYVLIINIDTGASQWGLNVGAIKLLILFVLPVTLFGCAGFQTLSQQTLASTNQNNQTFLKNSKTYFENCTKCMVDILRTDEAQRLKINYYISGEDSRSSDNLMNHNYLTDRDEKDFVLYVKNVQQCREKLIDDFSVVDQRYVNVLSENYIKSDENLSKLLKKEITISEYNNNYILLAEEVKDYMSNVDKIREIEKHAAAKAMRQVFSDNHLNNYELQYLLQQKLLRQMSHNKFETIKLTRINCSFTGNSSRCTSYR